MISLFLTNYIVQLTPFQAFVLLWMAFKFGQLVGYNKKLQKLANSNNCSAEIVPYVLHQQAQQSVKCENFRQAAEINSQTNINLVDTTKTKSENSESQQCLPQQLLRQKVQLQMKKVQSTSFFQMRLEPSSDSRFMRKIEKHELVTDYQMNAITQSQQQLVSFKSNPLNSLSQPNSLLELVAYQDHTVKIPSPLFQKKFIRLSQMEDQWRHQIIAPWILQNGRFNKFFKKSKYIGKGGYGCVVEAYSLLEQKQYAIKKIVTKGMLKMGELLNEANIISRYNHQNIIRFHTCWIQLATIDDALRFTSLVPVQNNNSSIKEQAEMMYVQSNSGFTFKTNSRKSSKKSIKNSEKANQIVSIKKTQNNKSVNVIQIYTLHIQMELCQNNLHSYLKNRQSVNHVQAFAIVNQLISGIQFLHSNGIVHRDLKPANVLLQKKQVKIGDFGLAALLKDHDQSLYHQKVGTPLYIAPQLINKNSIPKGQIFLVDIFSLGVIYYQLLHMFNSVTQHERSQKLSALQINQVSIVCKELKEQKQFIKLLTKTNNRPTVFELKQSQQYQRLKEKYKHL